LEKGYGALDKAWIGRIHKNGKAEWEMGWGKHKIGHIF
jgi:hypothetical protein